MNKQLCERSRWEYCLLVIPLLILSCNSQGSNSKGSASLDDYNTDMLISELSKNELIDICREERGEWINIYGEDPEGMCRHLAFHSNLVWEGATDDLEACENIVDDCMKRGAEEVFIDNCTDERRLVTDCDKTIGYLKTCLENRRQLLQTAVSDANDTNASCEIRAQGFTGWPQSFYDYSDHPAACEDIFLDDRCSLILSTFDRYADDLG
jgi:hypothetical protein